ncbi:MAG: ATP-dependent Clp protease ATP-binding subunit ClpX [Lachnospiraceae bacterium]|nr:ATP-dependent Clp protease ATP-binding subunit ClpX [Lachnospiraceae bacterium]
MDSMSKMDIDSLYNSAFPGMPFGFQMPPVNNQTEKVTGSVEDKKTEDFEKKESETEEKKNDSEEKKDSEESKEEKKENSRGNNPFGIPGFPNIQFVNWDSLGGGSNKNKVKKASKEQIKEEFDFKNIPQPHKLKEELDKYVIGQDYAKKVISVAVYNHYKRVQADFDGTNDVEIEKSNILMLGPTGCGKTFLVQTLAKILNVPLAIADATSLTEAGYIGDDIESVVSKLLAAAGNDVERAQRGIIFIDEIDKIAKKKNTNSRDVSGESVQQGMLKLLEGAEIEVPVGANSKNAMVPLEKVNTKDILFICGGAFPDLDEIIRERLSKETSIGFNAELKDHWDKEKNILKKVSVEDIKRFGMIPEFVGRLPIICPMEGLTEDMMVRILKEPKNAIIRQYQKLLEMDEVQLQFNDEALHAIAKKAMDKDTGARALRAIIEEFMLDIMFEVPKDPEIGRVTITKEFIEKKGGPIIDLRGVSELEQEMTPKLEDNAE